MHCRLDNTNRSTRRVRAQHLATALALAIMAASGGGTAAETVRGSAFAEDERDPVLVDVVNVYGTAPSTGVLQLSPVDASAAIVDAAGLVARLPGAALINNGAISGQVQYRGLFGPRINIRINGQGFESGGPNLMDPPLHYAPLVLVERIEVDRGVAPVSQGPGLGGGVNAVLKAVDFGSGPDWRSEGELSTVGRTGNDSVALGVLSGVANEQYRTHAFASYESGDDIDYPDGSIRSSDHERRVYGAAAGARFDAQELALAARRQHTGPTGNPPFAMDIRYFDTDFLSASWHHRGDPRELQVELALTDVEHAMNNFRARPDPGPARRRETFADARTLELRSGLRQALGAGSLQAGIDLRSSDKNVLISNPAVAGFQINSLPDIEERRSGVYLEWTGPVGAWQSELGLRLDHHQARAGLATVGPAVPMGPRNLADAFNASERDLDDTTVDAVARFWLPADDLTWRATLARKTRVGGYVERFSWLPTEASGGLADGNTYIGDQALDPEVAWQIEGGLDWSNERAYVRPTLYYRRIDDFIQGVPVDATPEQIDSPLEMVSAMNGDPSPLRFANVDATIHGFDMDFGYLLSEQWRLDGVLNWLRGERRDIDDKLYRMAPASLLLALSWQNDDWVYTLEGLAVAAQDDVSQGNSEARSAGYGVYAARADWRVSEDLELQLGLENLTDRSYSQHLAGYNRVADSDVPLGERLPGAGRSLHLRLNWRW